MGEEGRAGEHDQGDGDLAHHQEVAQRVPRRSEGGRAAFLDGPREVEPRGLQGRPETGGQARGHGHGDREGVDAPVPGMVGVERDVARGREPGQRLPGPARQDDHFFAVAMHDVEGLRFMELSGALGDAERVQRPERCSSSAAPIEEGGPVDLVVDRGNAEVLERRARVDDADVVTLVRQCGRERVRRAHGVEEPAALKDRLREVERRGVVVGLIEDRVQGQASGAGVRAPERHVHAQGGQHRTARDAELCAIIGPELRARGLLFVGIDVIGDYLTEINVTSPTGAQQLKRFGGADAAVALWDRIEALRANP